jgi:large subunit ribosomal protein L21
MYAIVRTGGKQYRVAEGDTLRVEKLGVEPGAEVVLGEVLAVGQGDGSEGGLKVGAPLVPGASVKATVVEHGLGDKVRIFKLRRRKHYKKTQGHRQPYTAIRITGISA